MVQNHHHHDERGSYVPNRHDAQMDLNDALSPLATPKPCSPLQPWLDSLQESADQA